MCYNLEAFFLILGSESYCIILFMRNHNTGMSNEGSMFSVLLSFSLSRESPDATIIKPPTISNSAIRASLIAVLDIFATR